MEPHGQNPWYLHVLRRNNPPKLSSSHSSTALGRGLLRRRIKTIQSNMKWQERIGLVLDAEEQYYPIWDAHHRIHLAVRGANIKLCHRSKMRGCFPQRDAGGSQVLPERQLNRSLGASTTCHCTLEFLPVLLNQGPCPLGNIRSFHEETDLVLVVPDEDIVTRELNLVPFIFLVFC